MIDTNVLVSGLLSPFGSPGAIVGLITAGSLCPCHDARILAEYNDVLRRPVFPFAVEEAAALMAQIRVGGELVAAKPLPLRLPDPDDQPFLEVAAAAMAEFLVTSNMKHFSRDRRQGVHVVSLREFLDSGLRMN